MNKAVNVLGSIIFGAVGFSLGIAGNLMGWIFVLAAAWSIVATICGRADAKDGQAGSNSWFDIGGGDDGGGDDGD
jgi:hypothetical protein